MNLTKNKMIDLFKQIYFNEDEIIEKNTKIIKTEIEDNNIFRRLKVTIDKIVICVISSGFKLTTDGKAYVTTNQQVTFDFDYKKRQKIFTLNGKEVNVN